MGAYELKQVSHIVEVKSLAVTDQLTQRKEPKIRSHFKHEIIIPPGIGNFGGGISSNALPCCEHV